MSLPTGAYAVTPDVVRVPIVFVNVYFVGAPGGPWVLVDTGLPGAAPWIRREAEARYGPGARPEAIVLTHGHFDHAGNARALSDAWGVPVYAHEREMPYLTGRSDYPPQDPTPGGAIAFLSRFFPTSGYDLGARVHALPEDGTVPALPAWQWLHTPGHTPGHVSLFRERDRTLLAGDAIATMDLDSWVSQVTHSREVSRPPVPFTPDWEAAHESAQQIAALDVRALGAGHGREITGTPAAAALRAYAARRAAPSGGRYVPRPAEYAPSGAVAWVPPPEPDPLPRRLAAGAAVGLGLAAVRAALRRA